MVNRKNVRTRGKIQLSKYFQDLKEGNLVSVSIEKAIVAGFPKRLQGRTGKIKGKKGRAYVVSIQEQKKKKEFIIPAIHLKKIKPMKKDDKKQ
jgi:large subunit ribosomal protein L21e